MKVFTRFSAALAAALVSATLISASPALADTSIPSDPVSAQVPDSELVGILSTDPRAASLPGYLPVLFSERVWEYLGDGAWVRYLPPPPVYPEVGSPYDKDYRPLPFGYEDRSKSALVSTEILSNGPVPAGSQLILRLRFADKDTGFKVFWGDGQSTKVAPGCEQGRVIENRCVVVLSHTYDTPGQKDASVKFGSSRAEIPFIEIV